MLKISKIVVKLWVGDDDIKQKTQENKLLSP